MWFSGGIPPQRYAPACQARLRAQWRSTDSENREAKEVRREWMTMLGMSSEEIEYHLSRSFDLDLVEELEQLQAALALTAG